MVEHRQFLSVDDVIAYIDKPQNEQVFIGHDYSVADLIRDLQEIERQRELTEALGL